jgi:hypothetical protein
VADRGDEVRLHLRYFFESPRHLGLGLVPADLREDQTGRGGQRPELVELALVEAAHVGVADDDRADPKVLDLERCDQGLAQTQITEQDMGVGLLVDLPHEKGPARPVHLGHDRRRGHVEHDRVRIEGIAVDPDRAHHLEAVALGVVEEDHSHLGVQVLADGPHQMGDDLGQRLGSGQGGAHRVETLEVEPLLVDLVLTRGRLDRLPLEFHPDQGGGGGDDHHRQHRSDHVLDGIGAAAEGDEGDGETDEDGHESVCPPGEEETRHCCDAVEDRGRGRLQLVDEGEATDAEDETGQPDDGDPRGLPGRHGPIPAHHGRDDQHGGEPRHRYPEAVLGVHLLSNRLGGDDDQDHPGHGRGASNQ